MKDNSAFNVNSAVIEYLIMMHEVAIRIGLVAAALDGKLQLTPPFAREYAYLQFRRVCELMALGCLQLHGDLPSANNKTTKKAWHAEKIMLSLHRDYPHAFPQSAIRIQTPQGWNIKANSKPNALTLSQFKEIYSECGSVLHRGTIESVRKNTDIMSKDYERVHEWQRRIVDLMNEHCIARANAGGLHVISLRTESGYPECSTFRKIGEQEFSVHTQRMTVDDDALHSYVANQKGLTFKGV